MDVTTHFAFGIPGFDEEWQKLTSDFGSDQVIPECLVLAAALELLCRFAQKNDRTALIESFQIIEAETESAAVAGDQQRIDMISACLIEPLQNVTLIDLDVYEWIADHLGPSTQVAPIMARFGVSEVDYIISSLPFANMPVTVREDILANSRKVLASDGRFILFHYRRILVPMLERHFDEINTEFELRNIPPAHVFACMREVPAPDSLLQA